MTRPTPGTIAVLLPWVEPAPGVQLVYLVFSSPLVDLREQLVQLFDTVVASVRVLDPSHPGASRATTEEDI